jgi:hypothetical protein
MKYIYIISIAIIILIFLLYNKKEYLLTGNDKIKDFTLTYYDGITIDPSGSTPSNNEYIKVLNNLDISGNLDVKEDMDSLLKITNLNTNILNLVDTDFRIYLPGFTAYVLTTPSIEFNTFRKRDYTIGKYTTELDGPNTKDKTLENLLDASTINDVTLDNAPEFPYSGTFFDYNAIINYGIVYPGFGVKLYSGATFNENNKCTVYNYGIKPLRIKIGNPTTMSASTDSELYNLDSSSYLIEGNVENLGSFEVFYADLEKWIKHKHTL